MAVRNVETCSCAIARPAAPCSESEESFTSAVAPGLIGRKVTTSSSASVPGAVPAALAPTKIEPRPGSWSDATAVKNGWLNVTVRATAATGLFTFSSFMFGNLVGDADGDRSVGPGDFNLLASHFGQSGQRPATGDFDADGSVGPGDFNLLASQFGATLPLPPTAAIRAQVLRLRE